MEKKQHGGKRREGRTQTPKSYRIDDDLVNKLAEEKNANQFVNLAIRERYERLATLIVPFDEL